MPPLRTLELFCGLGGIAALLTGPRATVAAEVVEAVDLDRVALSCYRANFPHPVTVRNLEAVTADHLPGADLWTMSPPCQPYTRRGRRRDLDDPRSGALRNLIRLLPEARPRFLLLENVPGFRASRAHRALLAALDGYHVTDTLLCPSELGWPNRRRRFYLLASRDEPLPPPAAPVPDPAVPDAAVPALADLIDPAFDDHPDLAVDPALAERYAGALSIVDAADPAAVTACFTSAYGRSPVRSGSYLAHDGGPAHGGRLRRFHPREILALLGFPQSYGLPADLRTANGWRLAGNSLSLPAVARVLGGLGKAVSQPSPSRR